MTTLTGLRRLVRLVLRRDRVRLPVWILALCGFIIISAASLPPVYPDQESIDDYARLFGENPALIAFAGPGYGFDDPNIGVILVNETQLFAFIGVALMSIFLVNRHTRAEEDAERTEVLRSSVIGRHAPTAAAVAVVSLANIVIAAACTVAFIGLDYGTTGSVALGASIAVSGLVFTGVTAVTAQITSGGRATLGMASAVLGAAFTLRAVGDIGDNALRWLSPLGWTQGVRAFAGERWWTLGLGVALALALAVSAFWLATRRDLGSGLVAQRPGPRTASPWITRPLGLATRLQVGSVVGWSVGLFLLGLIYGSIGQDIEEMIEENPAYADFLAQAEGASLTDSYLATSVSMLGLLVAGSAIASALRLRTEEGAGRAEPILAAPVSRMSWVASHLTVAVAGATVVLVAAGLGVGISYAVVAGDAGQVPRLVGAALVMVPAVLVLVGVAIALFGLVPRAALWAWAGLAVAVLVDLFGELLKLPEWTRQVSPFQHVPGLPAEDLRILPLVILAGVAAVLVAAGLRGFRQRDLRID